MQKKNGSQPPCGSWEPFAALGLDADDDDLVVPFFAEELQANLLAVGCCHLTGNGEAE